MGSHSWLFEPLVVTGSAAFLCCKWSSALAAATSVGSQTSHPKLAPNLQELLGDMDTLMRALPPTAQVRLGTRRLAEQHGDGG